MVVTLKLHLRSFALVVESTMIVWWSTQ